MERGEIGRGKRKEAAWVSGLFVAPRAGFEPATTRLTAERSTVELPRNTPLDDY